MIRQLIVLVLLVGLFGKLQCYSISVQDNNNFSIAKSDLPDDLASVSLRNGIVTFVYQDGHTKTKQVANLSESEKRLLEQLKQEAKQTSTQIKDNINTMNYQVHQNMQQMQHNMQHNMINLQNNMQNMQYGLQNMFGAGFPFGNRFTRN